MLQVLFGTGNPAKLEAMRHRLAELDMEIIGLREAQELREKAAVSHGQGGEDASAENCEGARSAAPPISEDGCTPLENARQKALAYYRAFRMPVFSCDTGLYFEGVSEEDQPGVRARRAADGREMTDEEMQSYYGSLVRRYGGTLTANYRQAICLVMDEEHIYEAMEPSMESGRFLLTDRPHPVLRKGFPLDAMSVDMKTGKYFYDLEESALEKVAVEDGFLEFFRRVLKEQRRDCEAGES